MNSITSKLLKSLQNLSADAVPRPPRPETENLKTENNNLTNEDTGDEIFIEPNVNESKKKKTSKFKQPLFSSKKKSNARPISDRSTKENSTSPILQATGNVINIINSRDIHWGPEIIYNMGTTGTPAVSAEKPSEEIKKTKSIVLVMEAKIKPEHEYIDCIAKNLGKNWYNFFRKLGYTQGRIETMEIDEARNGVSEARYKLLLDWVRNDDIGTLGYLATLLWQENEYQIVKRLAAIYKENNHSE